MIHQMQPHRLRSERGATLVEYAMGVALICVASLGAIQFMEDGSTENVERRTSTLGAPDIDETGTPVTIPTPPPTAPGDPPPPPPESLVSISTSQAATVVQRNVQWAATVGFTALDDTNNEREAVVIEGQWTGAGLVAPVAATCTTNLSGICAVTIRELACSQAGPVTLTVTSVSGEGVTLADPPLPLVVDVPKLNGSGQNQCQ